MPDPALVPLHRTARPNAPVGLWRGRLALVDGAQTIRGRGSIRLRLAPDSHISFRLSGRLSSLGLHELSDRAEVVLGGRRAAGVFVNVQIHGPTITYHGRIRGRLSIGEGRGLSRAVVHVFNFPQYVGEAVQHASGAITASRVRLRGGGWSVVMDAVEDAASLTQAVRRSGGHVLTHVAEISREDGSAFDADTLVEVVEVLGYALTFARSAWSFPALATGYAVGGAVWHEWGDRRLDPWSTRLTWFDTSHPETLAKTFAGLWPVWNDPSRRSVLRVAMGFATEANGAISPESRLVLAQAALELLAWHRLVGEGRTSNRKFQSMTAEVQLRELLRVSRVDAAIPASASLLSTASSIGSPADGAAAVTALRNRVAHPPRSRRHALLPSDVLVAGWRLALAYVHLVILRWLSCEGRIRSAVDLAPVDLGPGVVRP